MSEQFLTVKQFSQNLDVHPRTVVNWILKGHIKAINIAGPIRPKYRIPKEEEARFIESRTCEPANKAGQK